MRNYKIQLQDAGNGDAFLEIPDEIMNLMNLKDGDELKIEITGDGNLNLVPLKAQDKFSELVLATKLIARHFSKNQFNIDRKLPGGKTLFEKISDGYSGADVAKELIALFEQEEAQRVLVANKLEGRDKLKINLDDVGTPNLNDN